MGVAGWGWGLILLASSVYHRSKREAKSVGGGMINTPGLLLPDVFETR